MLRVLQRRVWMYFLLVMTGAVMHAAPAGATPITSPGDLVGPQTVIDFNSLPAGSLPSPQVISGVTFSGFLSFANTVIDTDGFQASINFPTFVSDKALGIADTDPSLPNYTIAFASPVAQVGFGLFDPNFLGNVISAYNSGGGLLETTSPDALFPPGGSGADYLGFVRGTADIAYIEIVAGVSGNTTDALWIDNLAFSSTPVPEPTTLLLLELGIAGLAFGRRRARS